MAFYITYDMFTLASTLKRVPRLQLEPVVTDILGRRYNVTVTFVGSKRAQSLNQQYRNKSYVPNVLSFPLDEQHGEIYICPEAAVKEHQNFDLSKNGYLTYLAIHGALHLKGYDHGAAMDKAEAKYCQKYNVT